MIRLILIGSKLLMLAWMFLFSNNCLSQTKIINGIIRDSINNIPVSYTGIALVHKNTGTTSSENGVFSINIDTITIHDTIAFSHVGYHTRRISVKELSEKNIKTVYLIERPLELKAVTVRTDKDKSKKHRNTIVLNDLKRRLNADFRKDKLKIIWGQNSTRFQTAVLFKVSSKLKNEWFIDKIKITLFDGTSSAQSMKFNLRFYAYDSIKNMPGAELFNKPVMVDAHNDMIKIVNLRDYRIQIPDDYFFVAVEWLIIDENQDTSLNSVILTKPKWYLPMMVELKESKDIMGVWDLNFNQNWENREEITGRNNSLDISVILRD